MFLFVRLFNFIYLFFFYHLNTLFVEHVLETFINSIFYEYAFESVNVNLIVCFYFIGGPW